MSQLDFCCHKRTCHQISSWQRHHQSSTEKWTLSRHPFQWQSLESFRWINQCLPHFYKLSWGYWFSAIKWKGIQQRSLSNDIMIFELTHILRDVWTQIVKICSSTNSTDFSVSDIPWNSMVSTSLHVNGNEVNSFFPIIK